MTPAKEDSKSVFDKYRVDAPPTPNNARSAAEWFNNQVKSLKGAKRVSQNSLLHDSAMTLTTSITPGKMYFFQYDPKYKETLPYYDTFPLVIPFNKSGNTFTGLNLHYLPYDYRLKLFNELLKINSIRKTTENRKILMSWDLIKSAAKTRGAAVCIKQYLFEHLRSPLAEVKPPDWRTAVLLPVHKFVGAKAEYIWRQGANVAR